jgi:hypothetical protein
MGEMVLLDLSRETYFALNDVGARMWTLLTAGQSVDATAASLVEEYDVPVDVLEADINRFRSEILDLGFAVPADAT